MCPFLKKNVSCLVGRQETKQTFVFLCVALIHNNVNNTTLSIPRTIKKNSIRLPLEPLARVT